MICPTCGAPAATNSHPDGEHPGCRAGRLAAKPVDPLVCEHGQLARSCERCDDARRISELERAATAALTVLTGGDEFVSAEDATALLQAVLQDGPRDVPAGYVERLEARVGELEAALAAALAEYAGLDDPAASYERRAEMFYADTGFMAPGKSRPLAMGGQSEKEAHEAWSTWNRKRVEAVRDQLRAALEGRKA